MSKLQKNDHHLNDGSQSNSNEYAKDVSNYNHLYRKNSYSDQLNIMESDLKKYYNKVEQYEEELVEKQLLLKPLNQDSVNGIKKLTPFAKRKLRREINELKQKIKTLKVEIKGLEKHLTNIYKKIDNKIIRGYIRKAAKHESYHNRYSNSIKSRIDDIIAKMPSSKLAILKAEVPKAEFKKGNTLIMKALLNAPRFLHTRVVANPTAREEYLSYFRGKLGASKRKFTKK